MSTNSLKILVAGEVCGKFSRFFKRVSDVNVKAGPFDLLLCVGDFFGTDAQAYDELINGTTDLPNVPTYILSKIPKQLAKFHPNIDNFDHGCELIDGITFLGRSGILTTSLGLRIAYLNGSYQEELNDDKDLEFFSNSEYESLLMSHQASQSSTIDILITTQWPTDVLKYTNTNSIEECLQNEIKDSSSTMISKLQLQLQPRYHFVPRRDFFYERIPFRNHQVLSQQPKNVTRFISMADIENRKKMKWIYAFNVTPAKHVSRAELVAQPDIVSENPFNDLDTVEEKSEQSARQFFYAMDSSEENRDSQPRANKREGKFERRPRKQMKVDLDSCWFCLASPNVDKTLIVSIGDYSYLALAKGGLTEHHLMILPIEHIRSTVEIEDEAIRQEIDKFKSALTEFFQKHQMVAVFFERNFRSAHFQVQVIGIPESKASAFKATAEEVFAKFDPHELDSNSDLGDVLSPGLPYFYCECAGQYRFFVRINTKKEFFPIQIGRELLAHKSLLDCEEKIDWRQCTSEPGEAQRLTKAIRAAFKPFDFTT